MAPAQAGGQGSARGVVGRRCRLGALFVLGAGLFTGCVQSSSSGTGVAGSLTVYSGQHVQTTEKLVRAFEARSGISVNLRSADERVLADQIATEGANSPADVFYAENSPPLQYLDSLRLLTKVDPSTLANTPSRFNSPNGHWVGVSARVNVLIYNTDQVGAKDLPTSILGLADPRWHGRVALAGSETDFQPVVTSVAQTYGKAAAMHWLEGLKANAAAHAYPDNETVTSQINKGQAAIGVVNQYYWYRLRAEVGPGNLHSAIASFAPHDPGYVLDVSGAGVLESSHHQSEAQRFVAFLTSTEAQEIIAHSDSFEYPIASGVTTAQAMRPFDQLQPNGITIAELGTGEQSLRLLQEVQLL